MGWRVGAEWVGGKERSWEERGEEGRWREARRRVQCFSKIWVEIGAGFPDDMIWNDRNVMLREGSKLAQATQSKCGIYHSCFELKFERCTLSRGTHACTRRHNTNFDSGVDFGSGPDDGGCLEGRACGGSLVKHKFVLQKTSSGMEHAVYRFACCTSR
jgi:hypothetical protein